MVPDTTSRGLPPKLTISSEGGADSAVFTLSNIWSSKVIAPSMPIANTPARAGGRIKHPPAALFGHKKVADPRDHVQGGVREHLTHSEFEHLPAPAPHPTRRQTRNEAGR
ncbi:hypothetical protein MASR1M32_37960 [Rhodobacter sp.]